MSMRNYPEVALGLMLFNDNGTEVADFCKAYTESFGIDESEFELYFIPDDIDICRIYDEDFDGSFWLIDKGDFKEYATGIFFRAEHSMSVFECAYNNIEEMVEEFKREIGKYLPGDFNYKSHIGIFEGTC